MTSFGRAITILALVWGAVLSHFLMAEEDGRAKASFRDFQREYEERRERHLKSLELLGLRPKPTSPSVFPALPIDPRRPLGSPRGVPRPDDFGGHSSAMPLPAIPGPVLNGAKEKSEVAREPQPQFQPPYQPKDPPQFPSLVAPPPASASRRVEIRGNPSLKLRSVRRWIANI